MPMDKVHLEPEEREFLYQFKEPIDEQLELMSRCVDAELISVLPALVAELTMFCFTIGRRVPKGGKQ